MTDEARAAKAAYMKKWREKNRETLRLYHTQWAKNNPEKVAVYQGRYWEKRIKKLNANRE